MLPALSRSEAVSRTLPMATTLRPDQASGRASRACDRAGRDAWAEVTNVAAKVSQDPFGAVIIPSKVAMRRRMIETEQRRINFSKRAAECLEKLLGMRAKQGKRNSGQES